MELIEIIKIGVGIVVAILAALGVAKIFVEKLKKEVLEALDSVAALAKSYKDSISESSENGEKLSPTEIQDLLVKVGEFFGEFVDVVNVIKEKLNKK